MTTMLSMRVVVVVGETIAMATITVMKSLMLQVVVQVPFMTMSRMRAAVGVAVLMDIVMRK